MIKWLPKIQRPATFESHTLIIPAVSVGNVGQMTVDLVLENARTDDNPKKIGQIFHSELEPVVANNIKQGESAAGRKQGKQSTKAQEHNNEATCSAAAVRTEEDCLMTACEIYHCPKKQWVVLQFHSAIRKRNRDKFVSFLMDWIRKSSFRMVVCFSSIFTSERLDVNITGLSSRIQVLYSDKIEQSYLDKISSLGWTRLLSPSVISSKGQKIGPLDHIEENLNSVNLSGSGITKSLLRECQSSEITCLTLMVYASDGDNTVDALFLYKEASHLFQLLPQAKFGDPPSKIKIPYLWHQHLGVTPKIGLDGEELNIVSTSAKSRGRRYDDPPNIIF